MTVSLHTGLSNPGAQEDGVFCLTTDGADLDQRETIWEKTNTSFSLAVEGLDSFYCNMITAPGTEQILNPIEERKTMLMSKVTVTNIKGCFSILALPGVDLLDLDTICNTGITLTDGVKFHMGEDCGGEEVVCPTETVATTEGEGTFINYNVKLFIEDALWIWGYEPFELNSTVVAMPQPQKPLCFSS
eukprot:sb/3471241/